MMGLLLAAVMVALAGFVLTSARLRTGQSVGVVLLIAVVKLVQWAARWLECLYLALDSFAVRWVEERRAPRRLSEIEFAVKKGASDGEMQMRGAAGRTGLERMATGS